MAAIFVSFLNESRKAKGSESFSAAVAVELLREAGIVVFDGAGFAALGGA